MLYHTCERSSNYTKSVSSLPYENKLLTIGETRVTFAALYIVIETKCFEVSHDNDDMSGPASNRFHS